MPPERIEEILREAEKRNKALAESGELNDLGALYIPDGDLFVAFQQDQLLVMDKDAALQLIKSLVYMIDARKLAASFPKPHAQA